MGMQAEDIKRMVKAALPDAVIELIDTAGDGDHYKAIITCATFAGKSRVQQHQMVYAALRTKMGSTLHALALETRIPDTQSK